MNNVSPTAFRSVMTGVENCPHEPSVNVKAVGSAVDLFNSANRERCCPPMALNSPVMNMLSPARSIRRTRLPVICASHPSRLALASATRPIKAFGCPCSDVKEPARNKWSSSN